MQLDKTFYSVTKWYNYRDFTLSLAPLGADSLQWPCSLLAAAVVGRTGQSSYHHHKLAEVDFRVSVKIQTIQQLVHLFLVLCRLWRRVKNPVSIRAHRFADKCAFIKICIHMLKIFLNSSLWTQKWHYILIYCWSSLSEPTVDTES